MGAERNLGDQLDDLARRVRRLEPLRRDPEAFHAEKSEIAEALRQAASEARQRQEERR
jgi:hypothetical protein